MKFPRIANIPTPLLLLLVTILAYGLMLPLTGFYWDDWTFAWIARFLGPGEFFPAFAPFRPFLGPIFYLTTSLLPTNPLLWQVFGVFIRFLTGLSAWLALDALWPARKARTVTAALLFLVFPAYSQQWVALTHINQELIPLTFYLLSFWLTIRALRTPQRFLPLTLGALALHVCGIFPTEYFFGLEAMRFFFLWFIVSETETGFIPRLRKTFQFWWPYLLVWVTNAAWLVYYYKFGAYNSYAITAGEATTSAERLTNLVTAMGDALYKTALFAWVQVFGHVANAFPSTTSLLTVGLVVATFVGMLFLWKVSQSDNETKPNTAEHVTLLLAGLAGILLGRVPSWAAGLPLTLQSSYDRFTVSMMLGAALLIVGLLELIRRARVRTVVISALIALAIGQQFWNANIFRRDWEGQRAIYWQFAWRIPALEPGTILFTHQMPLDYETDLSMTAPLNWIYAPDYQRGQALPFVLLYPEKRLGGVTLPSLDANTGIKVPYRTVAFTGNTSRSVTVFVPPNRDACLRVLDPVYANAEVYAKQSRFLTMTIPLSDPSLIRVDAPAPDLPASIFGREPKHTWCYFYEKAESARQRADWQAVRAVEEDAARLGFAPVDAFEWLPFIEAQARLGSWDEATHLSRLALEMDARVRKGVCQVWARVRAENAGQAEGLERSETALAEFKCR